METIFYTAKGELYTVEGGVPTVMRCEAVENYRDTVREIQRNREWKSSGTGARFMGIALEAPPVTEIRTSVEAVAAADPDKLIYAVTLESSCGLYSKNPQKPHEPEGYIIRKTNTRFYHMDFDPVDRLLALSASDSPYERHLALCNEEKANFRLITEGDCVDMTPSFSQRNNKLIYFSSAGFYQDKGQVHYGNYGISRFDLRTNDIVEVAQDDKCHLMRPWESRDGTLYCIRRPRAEERDGMTFTDVVLFPVRVLRAILGWLNFFTQRYSGESLIKRTKGENPAKNREANEEEIFIEGNLVNVEQSLKENRLAGEKHPGIAPKSWELVMVKPGGEMETVKRGVLDYTLLEDGSILYSNGRYILKRAPDGREELVCEAKVAGSISAICTHQ